MQWTYPTKSLQIVVLSTEFSFRLFSIFRWPRIFSTLRRFRRRSIKLFADSLILEGKIKLLVKCKIQVHKNVLGIKKR